jgi:hypothetical protein
MSVQKKSMGALAYWLRLRQLSEDVDKEVLSTRRGSTALAVHALSEPTRD